MDESMTSTTFTLDGYQIVQSLGVVRGVTVRSRSLLGTIGARSETLFGGHISMLTTLCERARSDAFDILWRTRSGEGPTGWWASGTTPRRSCPGSPRCSATAPR